MGKRTSTSPFRIERLEGDIWRGNIYENSPRLARRRVREFMENKHCAGARAIGNPNNESRDLGVIFEILNDNFIPLPKRDDTGKKWFCFSYINTHPNSSGAISTMKILSTDRATAEKSIGRQEHRRLLDVWEEDLGGR